MSRTLSAKILRLERIVRQDPINALTDRQLNDRLVVLWHDLYCGEGTTAIDAREQALVEAEAGDPALFDCRWPHLFRAVGFHDVQQVREMTRKLKAEPAA